jgi:hypothetical protein
MRALIERVVTPLRRRRDDQSSIGLRTPEHTLQQPLHPDRIKPLDKSNTL